MVCLSGCEEKQVPPSVDREPRVILDTKIAPADVGQIYRIWIPPGESVEATNGSGQRLFDASAPNGRFNRYGPGRENTKLIGMQAGNLMELRYDDDSLGGSTTFEVVYPDTEPIVAYFLYRGDLLALEREFVLSNFHQSVTSGQIVDAPGEFVVVNYELTRKGFVGETPSVFADFSNTPFTFVVPEFADAINEGFGVDVYGGPYLPDLPRHR